MSLFFNYQNRQPIKQYKKYLKSHNYTGKRNANEYELQSRGDSKSCDRRGEFHTTRHRVPGETTLALQYPVDDTAAANSLSKSAHNIM